MGKTNFWNSAARGGAIIGVLLGISSVLENVLMLSGRMSMYYLLFLEYVAVVALHFYLLYRFTRQRSRLYAPEEGFPFMQGYLYQLAMSGFAGIILGAIQAVYLHLVVGYSNYMDRLVSTINEFFARYGSANASMQHMLEQSIAQVKSAPVPTVPATVWGGIVSGMLFGLIFGLIVAAILVRAPKPFASGPEGNNE